MRFEIVEIKGSPGKYYLLGPDGNWKWCESPHALLVRLQAAFILAGDKSGKAVVRVDTAA